MSYLDRMYCRKKCEPVRIHSCVVIVTSFWIWNLSHRCWWTVYKKLLLVAAVLLSGTQCTPWNYLFLFADPQRCNILKIAQSEWCETCAKWAIIMTTIICQYLHVELKVLSFALKRKVNLYIYRYLVCNMFPLWAMLHQLSG